MRRNFAIYRFRPIPENKVVCATEFITIRPGECASCAVREYLMDQGVQRAREVDPHGLVAVEVFDVCADDDCEAPEFWSAVDALEGAENTPAGMLRALSASRPDKGRIIVIQNLVEPLLALARTLPGWDGPRRERLAPHPFMVV